jgi:hypothetical protein
MVSGGKNRPNPKKRCFTWVEILTQPVRNAKILFLFAGFRQFKFQRYLEALAFYDNF